MSLVCVCVEVSSIADSRRREVITCGGVFVVMVVGGWRVDISERGCDNDDNNDDDVDDDPSFAAVIVAVVVVVIFPVVVVWVCGW